MTATNATASAGSVPRFYGLDVMRGLAALVVVIFHWENVPAFFGVRDRAGMPLYDWMPWVYEKGWLAVHLFFALSGFVFFWLYEARIAEGRVGWRTFWVLRFSRLYPLHFVTLLYMAAAQALLEARTGERFISVSDTPLNFVLQLFLASEWWPGRNGSFNFPVWSVSVEVLLYACFFLAVSLRRHGMAHRCVLAAAGLLLIPWWNSFGHGLLSFFVGGVVHGIWQSLQRGPARRRTLWLAVLALVTPVLWIVFADDAVRLVPYELYREWLHTPALLVGGRDLAGAALLWVAWNAHHPYELLVFPCTILTLALAEPMLHRAGRRLAFLGDISYASYLLHTPLMMVVVAVTIRFGLPLDVFRSPWSLGAFLLALTGLSWVCYRRFERPAQRWLRNRFDASRCSGADT